MKSFEEDISHLKLTCILTLLGGVVFYWLWEAKSVYSAPFMPVATILAVEGFEYVGSTWLGNVEARASRLHHGSLRTVLLPLVGVSSVALVFLSGVQIERQYERLSILECAKAYTPITYEKALSQSFCADKPFNAITFCVKPRNADGVAYDVVVASENGSVLLDTSIDANSIDENNHVELEMDCQYPPDSGCRYVVRISRIGTGKDSMAFLNTKAELIDSYEGTLLTDGDEYPLNDLKMKVGYKTTERTYGVVYTAVITAAYLALSLLGLIEVRNLGFALHER